MKTSLTKTRRSLAALLVLAGTLLPVTGCDNLAGNAPGEHIAADETGGAVTPDQPSMDPAAEDSEQAVSYDETPTAQPGSPGFTVHRATAYGGEKADSARAIVATADGGLALAGYTRSSGAGLSDVLAMKLDGNGAVQWSKTFGSADYDAANAIVACSDGGYVLAGYTQSYGAEYEPAPHAKKDIWLIKIDESGNKEWETLFGGEHSSENALALRQCSDGGYIVTGFVGSAGASGYDCLTLRFDGNGDVLWSRTAGGPGFDSGHDILETSAGTFIVAGETASFGAGHSDFYILCYSMSGELLWAKTFGGPSFERARALVERHDGTFIAAGYSSSWGAGHRDIWMVTFDRDGTTISDHTLGGASCDEAFAITAMDDGNYAVAGNTSSYGAGELDFWVVVFGQ